MQFARITMYSFRKNKMIEPVPKNNLNEILPLIRAYQSFYKVEEISDEKNIAFFSQFGASNPFGCQFLFRESGKVVGFATVFFTYASTIAAKVAVLSDLYTLSRRLSENSGRSEEKQF